MIMTKEIIPQTCSEFQMVKRCLLLICFVGAAGILWFVAWQLIVHESPSEHPTISEDEKNYIERSFEKGNVRDPKLTLKRSLD